MKKRVKKLSAGTVYKLIAMGLLFSIVPFSLLMGVFAVFGAETVSWNDQPITGIKGLIASPIVGLFIVALVSGFMGTAVVFGLWVYSWFKPISISYVADE